MSQYYGGIEAGGTKFVCAIGRGPGDILIEERFPTTHPEQTINKAVEFFMTQQNRLNLRIQSLGIGCFGPIDLNPQSKSYGYITSTPKPGWKDTNIVAPLQQALQIPVSFDTDVNAAAIGEGKWGAGFGLRNFIYFTIGTGVGGGALIDGQPLHGLIHPEMGHILLQRNPDDNYKGFCPYHHTCFEGMACGPAISERWGTPTHHLPTNHPAWELEADYIAQALSSLICSFSPEKIILGGGVMQQKHLFPIIQMKTLSYLNGYVQSSLILNHIQEYIVPPGLGNQSGILGSIALAQSLN